MQRIKCIKFRDCCIFILGLLHFNTDTRAESHADNRRTLIVAYVAENPLAADVAVPFLKQAYARLGLAATFKSLPSSQSLDAANQDELDAEAIRTAEIVRQSPNLIAVPEPIMTVSALAITNGLTFTVNGWESLRPYRLCIFAGDLIAVQRTTELSREIDENYLTMFASLKAGRCDVAVAPRFALLAANPLNMPKFHVIEDPIETFDLVHAVTRKNADLAPRLAQTFKELKLKSSLKHLLDDFARRMPVLSGQPGHDLVIAWPEQRRLSYLNTGELSSFTLDIVRESFLRAHLGLIIKQYPWARCIEEVKHGHVDGIVFVNKTSDRETYLDYPKNPINSFEYRVYFSKSGKLKPTDRIADLYDKRVGIVRSTRHGDLVDDAIAKGEFHLLSTVENNESLALMLANGRLDAAFANADGMSSALESTGLTDRVIAFETPLHVVPAYLAFARQKELGSEITAFEKAFQTMVEDGTYEKIQAKYNLRDY